MNAFEFVDTICKPSPEKEQHKKLQLEKQLHQQVGEIIALSGSQNARRHDIDPKVLMPTPSVLLDFFL